MPIRHGYGMTVEFDTQGLESFLNSIASIARRFVDLCDYLSSFGCPGLRQLLYIYHPFSAAS